MSENNGQQLLIDFNSPLQKKLGQSFSELTPLVPAPDTATVENKQTTSNENALITNDNDADNNPFDLVDHQTNLNIRMLNDPFELVYQKALKLSNEKNNKSVDNPSDTSDVQPNENLETSVDPELVQINNSSISSHKEISNMYESIDGNASDNDQSLGILNSNFFDTTDISFKCVANVTNPCDEISANLSNICRDSTQSLNCENKDNVAEPNSTIHKNSDLKEGYDSSDEALIAIVANRVNACIQNALQQSKILGKEDLTNNHEESAAPFNGSMHNISFPKVSSQVSTQTYVRRAHSFYEIDNPVSVQNKCNASLRRSVGSCSELSKSYCATGCDMLNISVHEREKNVYSKLRPDILKDVNSSVFRYNEQNESYKRGSSDFPMKQYEKCGKLDVSISQGNFETVKKCLSGGIKETEQHALSKILNSRDSVSQPLNVQKDVGDDPIFLEANNVAFLLLSSFKEPEEEEEDILNCQPQWETSKLNLPKFNFEEKENQEIEKNGSDSVPGKYVLTSPPDELKIKEASNKQNKISVILPSIVKPALFPVVKETDGNIRIKSKQSQQLGKKGPLKAVVPLDNMMRTAKTEKKASPVSKNLSDSSIDSVSPDSAIRKGQLRSQLKFPKNVSRPDSKPDANSSKGFGNRSFTSPATPVQAPTLRRANSLTSGIPSLTSPAVSLISQPSSPMYKHQNGPHLNLSGLVATSTPTKRIANTSANKSLIKTLPSPILVKENKSKSPSLESSLTKQTKTATKNKSYDENQHQPKGKNVLNKAHGRSKSATIKLQKENSPKNGIFSNNSIRKIVVASDKDRNSNMFMKNKTESRLSQAGILKPLHVNTNGKLISKNNKTESRISPASRGKPLTQLFSKLKNSPLLQVEKENLKPL